LSPIHLRDQRGQANLMQSFIPFFNIEHFLFYFIEKRKPKRIE
jgi:hypothetical protein